MTETKPKRRWFRFGLRTLLIFIGIAAFLCWAYWIGWPHWKIYREQVRFEKSVSHLKAGNVSDDIWHRLYWHTSELTTYTWNIDGKKSALFEYYWPNDVYFIYVVYRDKIDTQTIGSNPFLRVEVFRLPPPSMDYAPQTAGGVFQVDSFHFPSDSPERPTAAYRYDFLDFISGDRKNNPGFQYELIYSDPPTNSVQ